MANILITFADEKFCNSAWLLALQAKRCRIFNKIKIFTPRDLPPHILASPLFNYERGHGYWLWKPYIIQKMIHNSNDGDLIFYVDAGCSINRYSNDWDNYLALMEKYNAIFFEYKSDFNYHWESYGRNSVKIKHWTKPSTIDFFSIYLGNTEFLDKAKIWGGFMIFKSKQSDFVSEWMNISLFHPELVMDPFGLDLVKVPHTFNAHRHDQSIITPLVHKYKDIDNLLILPEKAESDKASAAVVAKRQRIGKLPFLEQIKFRLYHLIMDRDK